MAQSTSPAQKLASSAVGLCFRAILCPPTSRRRRRLAFDWRVVAYSIAVNDLLRSPQHRDLSISHRPFLELPPSFSTWQIELGLGIEPRLDHSQADMPISSFRHLQTLLLLVLGSAEGARGSAQLSGHASQGARRSGGDPGASARPCQSTLPVTTKMVAAVR